MSASPTTSEFSVAESLHPWSATLRGRTFLWLLAPPWDGVWTRQNHFATRIARLGGEVLYVENPTSWTSLIRQRRWSQLRARATPSVRTIEPRLHVITPGMVFPGAMRSDLVAAINGRRIAADVRRWTVGHGWKHCVTWCRLPHALFALRALDPTTMIYDITDDYELYASSAAARRLVNSRERKLVAQADAIFLTTKELRHKQILVDVPTHVVPNGVDYELFASASQPGEIDAKIRALSGPVIGYVGLTSHWMDFELLTMLGRRWPNQVVMVGPIGAEVETRARSIPGIVWTGFVPQRELAPYLRGFDLASCRIWSTSCENAPTR